MTVTLYWFTALDWVWVVLVTLAVFLVARTIWRITVGGGS